MEDKKIIRGILSVLSTLLTSGWIVWALLKHNWVVLVAVISTGFGFALHFALKETKKD